MSLKRWLSNKDNSKDKEVTKEKERDATLTVPQPSGSISRNGSLSNRSSVSSKASTPETLNHQTAALDATLAHAMPEIDEGVDESSTLNGSDPSTPAANEDFPYGDGSNKIFGMENFGNTCYCNSIVQCLYYTNDFRREVLKHPHAEEEGVQRHRRRVMPGLKPHPATKIEVQEANDKKEEPKPSRVTLGRRTSNFFGRNKRDSRDECTDTETPPASTTNNGQVQAHATIPATNSTTATIAAPSNNASTQPAPNTTTITIPNIRSRPTQVVVGKIDDPSATVEARKKAALTTGPIINLDHSLQTGSTTHATLFTALKDLFESEVEHESLHGVVSPTFLVETLKKENELFRSAMHQDAHEFLNFLLNEVIDSLEKEPTGNTTSNPIRQLFEGHLTNQTKCLTCENVTSRDETFLDLSLDLLESQSLSSCLTQFSASEMLAGTNKFYCDNCHSLQEAEKKMGLRKLPRVLALHLKRFKYSEEHRRNVKLFHMMKYPLYLKLETDLPPEDPKDAIKFYELYAVVVHIGGGPHHGHYVALVKTQDMGWLLFDDETVEKIDEAFVLRFIGDSPDLATAYVLFYREIAEEKYEEESRKKLHEDEEKKQAAVAAAAAATTTPSKPIMNGFNTGFNMNMNSAESNASLTDSAADSVSPLDKVVKVPSNNVSIDSSNPSTVSSEKTRPQTADSQHTSGAFSRIKKKSSVSSNNGAGATPPSGAGGNADKHMSDKPSFWRRSDNKSDHSKSDQDKEKEKVKKKNRMSMVGFGFKRTVS